MDPTELLDQLERLTQANISSMAEALANGVCLSNSAPDRAYANCVGRVEGWKIILAEISDLRQKYIEE